ncbi:MAG: carbon-nitrogen hydrolase family protein [Clostridium sp.]
MKIGLASGKFPKSIEEGIDRVKYFIKKAKAQQCDIVCFPECYIPGMRNQGVDIPPHNQEIAEDSLEQIRKAAEEYSVAVILPMEWGDDIIYNVAFVISEKGKILGYQAKNQLDPSEDNIYGKEAHRRIFEVKGVKFGISICHEGWRYPETVRWAAMRGAQIVFHPQCTGSDINGNKITEWGQVDSPYYEKAMISRSVENAIYFASINYAMEYQDSATSIISPQGECLAYVPYGEEELLVQELDLEKASLLYAKRYNEDLYLD